MKKDKTKELLLSQLRKTPIIQIACEKSHVARASFYRWKAKNKRFAKAAEEAITEGEMLITDMSEMQLIGLIRDKNFQAVQLWLRHHHPKYSDKVEINGHLTYLDEDLTPKQASVVKQALRLAFFEKKHGKEK